MKPSSKRFLYALGLLLVAVAVIAAISHVNRSFRVSKQLAEIPAADESQILGIAQSHNACQLELITDNRPAMPSENFSVIKVFEEVVWHSGRSVTSEWSLRKEAPQRLTLVTKTGHSKIFVEVSDLDTEYLSALASAYDWGYDDSPLIKSIIPTLPKDDRVYRKPPDERLLAIKGLGLEQHVTAIGTVEKVGADFWLRPFRINASEELQPVILSSFSAKQLTKYLKDTLRVGDAQDEKAQAHPYEYYASEPRLIEK